MGQIYKLVSIAILALAAGAGLAGSARAADPAIVVKFVGLKNDKGRVGCELFNSEQGFPKDRSRALKKMWTSVAQNEATAVFGGVGPGKYAVTCFHDQGLTGQLTKNFLGVPTEEYGFSNNARVVMGPPSFTEASFDYSGGSLTVTINAQ